MTLTGRERPIDASVALKTLGAFVVFMAAMVCFAIGVGMFLGLVYAGLTIVVRWVG